MRTRSPESAFPGDEHFSWEAAIANALATAEAVAHVTETLFLEQSMYGRRAPASTGRVDFVIISCSGTFTVVRRCSIRCGSPWSSRRSPIRTPVTGGGFHCCQGRYASYAKVFVTIASGRANQLAIIYSVVRHRRVQHSRDHPLRLPTVRREFKPRRHHMFLFTVLLVHRRRLIPPNYLLYKALGINNTMWVFILPGAVSVYNVIVARSLLRNLHSGGAA